MTYGFIYVWYDRKTKMFCLGSHYGKLNDGYVTSTGWMKAAYKKRPEDFKRRIIYQLEIPCKLTLLKEEQRWLDMIDDSELSTSANVIAKTNRFYNMKKQARGGNGSANKGKPGHPPWNKGLKGDPRCLAYGAKTSLKVKGVKKSEAHKEALRKKKRKREPKLPNS